jgi:hypothetical protein
MLCSPKLEKSGYRRRAPEQELLHRILVAHLETFLEHVNAEDYSLPKYVERELREFVRCGVLAAG